MSNPLNKNLEVLLLEEKLITTEQMEKALEEQKNSKEDMEQILITLGYVTRKDICKTLGKEMNVPFIDLEEIEIDGELARTIPEHIARKYKVIPVSMKETEIRSEITEGTIKELPDEISINKLRRLINEVFLKTELRDRLGELNYKKEEIETILKYTLELPGNIICLAMEDPLNVIAIDDVRLITGFEIEPVIATEKSILRAINKYFGVPSEEDEVQYIDYLTTEVKEKDSEELKNLKELADKAPVVRVANLIISQAITDKAGAVYIEPGEEEMSVFYKIDGSLHEVMNPPKDIHEPLINRIKLMADLDILEKSLPREGCFTLIHDGKVYGLRVCTSSSAHGEKISITILYKEIAIDEDKSGIKGKRKVVFQHLLSKENGMIIIAGPSQSGKSTTLYTVLNMLEKTQGFHCKSNKNICVIGDYIYSVPGINQVELNPLKGFTIQSAFKNIIHQDFDIIVVEDNISEKETLEIALKTAFTKKLVFTTLAEGNTVSVIKGLFNMGLNPFQLSSLKGIIFQRLVPLICPDCRETYIPSDEEIEKFNSAADAVFYRGRGCDKCNGTGYKGQSPIFEIMVIDKKILSLILKKAEDSEIKDMAVQNGMITLEEELSSMVLKGNTTIEEFLKIM